MTFVELAKKRYSCRLYKNEKVSDDKLLDLLEAARIAPSAVNYQPWHFIVITEKHLLEKIYEAYNRDWFKTAPVVIVICGDKAKAWKRKDGKNHCDIDIAIATDHITLKATEMGLATCWVCNFDTQKVSELLALPPQIEPIVLLPLGYPNDKVDENRHSQQRKELSKIVHWNKFEIK
jgi:nitroreductase